MKQRLIDANEFAIEEPKLWDWSSIDGISSTAVLKQCIWDVQCAPTVKAIPIEWIKDYIIPFQVHHDSLSEESKENDGAGWVIEALESMLKEWEKENEISVMPVSDNSTIPLDYLGERKCR